ncbi:MAG: hypothetical protein BZ137_06120 [Methanosphaera sp. rholeuAM130]|nr:MAG: hypothetical protein BZ137_06120 [Methanosphaera sp. rholeuAM130]
MGIGSWIIDWVTGFVLKIRFKHGIRYLSVDAYNKSKVINFYKNNQFIIYDKNKSKKENYVNIPMYLDINYMDNY